MILLVFEGQKDEPIIMATIKALFFHKEEEYVLCSYGTDTYSLWKEVSGHIANGYEADVFQIVKAKAISRGDHSLDKYDSYEFEAIYLFFDYDPQNAKLGLPKINTAVTSIIKTFNDPMDSGQIFISYPMVEALYCEDCFPDTNFMSATVALNNCRGFKRWSKKYYVSTNKECVRFRANRQGEIKESINEVRNDDLKKKWIELIKMNSAKANLICNNDANVPANVSQIPQSLIYQQEYEDYVTKNDTVSILSSFPLFLFEYFHGNGDF